MQRLKVLLLLHTKTFNPEWNIKNPFCSVNIIRLNINVNLQYPHNVRTSSSFFLKFTSCSTYSNRLKNGKYLPFKSKEIISEMEEFRANFVSIFPFMISLCLTISVCRRKPNLYKVDLIHSTNLNIYVVRYNPKIHA